MSWRLDTNHLYIVVYDISDQKRWRRVFKTMKSFGEWIQLSVFQCVLSKKQLLRLEHALHEIVASEEDHVLIADLGPSGNVGVKFKSLGKDFEPLKRRSIVV